MSGRGPGRPRKSDRPDRLAQVSAAAIELFGEQGYAAVTFASVARRADMTPAALYHYFDDKAALYLSAARQAREATWTAIDQQFEPQANAVEDFLELAKVTATLRGDTRAGLRLLASVQVIAAHHAELRPLLDERFEVRHSIVGDIGRRAYDRGELKGLADAEEAATAIELIFSGWVSEGYGLADRRSQLTTVAANTIAVLTGQRS